MNEGNPTYEWDVFVAQFGDSKVECSSSLGSIRLGTTRHGITSLFKKSFVECIRNLGAIRIMNRPNIIQNSALEQLWCTHDIAATTPRKPAKSNVEPRCITSSGRFSSPMAVSHALRNASEACGMDCCMIWDTFSGPSWRSNALSSGFFGFCCPWHGRKWSVYDKEADGRCVRRNDENWNALHPLGKVYPCCVNWKEGEQSCWAPPQIRRCIRFL